MPQPTRLGYVGCSGHCDRTGAKWPSPARGILRARRNTPCALVGCAWGRSRLGAREGASRRLGRARARARVAARDEPVARPSCTRRRATPASPGSATAIRSAPTTATGCSGSRARSAPTSSWSGRRRRSSRASRDELRHAGIAVFGPGAEAARIEGSKSFAKDVMAAAGVPAAASASRRERAVRGQGRRARRREGRLRLPHRRGGRRRRPRRPRRSAARS